MTTASNPSANSACADAYLLPPAVINTPGHKYSAATRKFQGIPSLACGPEGRLWAVWYGGVTPGEDHNNYVMLVTSADHGRTWSDERLVVDPDGDGPVRAFDPEVWVAPDGRMRFFWAQGVGHMSAEVRVGVWEVSCGATDAAAQWSAPRRLCDGVMMCKPLVLATGEWALPVSLWHRRADGSATLHVSGDQGRTWTQRGACDVPPEVPTFDEHMVLERRDGSLRMLVRTKYGIGESLSTDRGRTWSALQPTGIPHPCSRFFIRRLASGRVLMVRHVPAAGEAADGQAWGKRNNLTAFVSEDDGATWPHSLLLDAREGVSYPDGDQAADGTIHIIYDYQRTADREILMAAFREEDVLRGTADPAAARLRVRVNKANG